ncbi:MAG: hypothetical protein R3F54_08980 [Alphaproteobacteria bacterium]
MLNKILFTVFAIVAIWKVFSLVSKLQKEGGILARDSARRAPRRPGERQGEPAAVEMVACPRCGAYIDPRERCSCRT